MSQASWSCGKGLAVALAALAVVSCWPRISQEVLPVELAPSTLLDAYPYAQAKAAEWSAVAFLEGASASYAREGDMWKLGRLSYVFVDAEQEAYMMIVVDSTTRTVQVHPPRRIERSMVSTYPFFLQDNPVDERQALEAGDDALGNRVVRNCGTAQVVLKGNGFGDSQYWGLTYTAREPVWRVVGELSVDAVTGQVIVLDDATDHCN